MHFKKRVLLLSGIVLLSLTAPIAAMVYFRTYDTPLDRDHWNFGYEAGRVARSLATGQGFSSPMPEPSGPTAFLPPGYPLLLAGIFWVFGVYTPQSAVAAYLLNALILALTCIGLYRLGAQLFGERVGLAAAAVFAVYPPSIWYAASTIWDTSLLAFTLVLLMNWLYSLPQRLATKHLVLTGLLMGAIGLFNPAPVFFYPAVAFMIFRKLREQGLNGLRGVAILTASCLVLILPWMVRNAVVLGVFTPRTCVGLNLRLGNSEGAWKLGTGGFDGTIYPSNSAEEERIFYELGEAAYDRRCGRLGMEFIRDNPGKFAALTLMRVRGWWLGQGGIWAGNLKTTLNLSTLKRLLSILPLPFFLVGCFAAWRNGKPVGLLLALILIYPLPYYFLIVAARYRFPLEPFLVLLAVYGLASIGRRLSPSR